MAGPVKLSVDPLFHPEVAALEVEEHLQVSGDLAVRYPKGVDIAAKATKISHGVHVQGALRGVERETCSRCLEPFERPIDIEVAETFSEDVGEGEDFYGTVSPLVNRTIDLTDLVSQLLEVDEPLAPLCMPSCAGICPTCGANRNTTVCRCTHEVRDPRLAGLARLRDELENE
jgi:uncharacterized protein